MDVLDAIEAGIKRSWAGKRRHSDARSCAKGSGENASTICCVCPRPCSGRARGCCGRCCWGTDSGSHCHYCAPTKCSAPPCNDVPGCQLFTVCLHGSTAKLAAPRPLSPAPPLLHSFTPPSLSRLTCSLTHLSLAQHVKVLDLICAVISASISTTSALDPTLTCASTARRTPRCSASSASPRSTCRRRIRHVQVPAWYDRAEERGYPGRPMCSSSRRMAGRAT